MPTYNVGLSEDLPVTIDLPPGAPALAKVSLDFEASTEDELREMVRALGFRPEDLVPDRTLQMRYHLPVTRDGETVGYADVMLTVNIVGEVLSDRASG